MKFLSRITMPFKKNRRNTKIRGNERGDLSSGRPTPPTPAFRDGDRSVITAPSRSGNMPSPLGFFTYARDTTLNNPVFVEYTTGSSGELAAMNKLMLHVDSNAAVDSSTRQPPPTCHPKTRLEIRQNLTRLFDDPLREYVMSWLSGAAGTGKSAAGQTFSEDCQARGRLGAAFFFSRPNGRNRYETVIPTLACQLATHCPAYRPAMIARIDNDPQIFDKSPSVQIRTLIVEPLLEVRTQIKATYLMLLDGVDECGAHPNDTYEREREQRELIKMIADTVRNHSELLLFWLLCSRPEQHLLDAFTRIMTICRREELVIDAKCRQEVEVVLREGFAKIAEERGVIPPGPDGWPSKAELNTVERAVSGLYVFGAAILKDIEHSDSPVRQLKTLIPFLERVAGAGPTRSIRDMDSFYAYILEDVSKEEISTTLRIIGVRIAMPGAEDLSAQALCNFLRLDPNDFSSALRKVHSVVNIPSPEFSQYNVLCLYHASFSDFLTNASRSGKFFIDQKKVLVDIAKLCFFWHELHSNLFHSSDQPFIFSDLVIHEHDPLPQGELGWITSVANHQAISKMICRYAETHCFRFFQVLHNRCDEELISLVHSLDLRHMTKFGQSSLRAFLEWVCKHDASSGFIRTEPQGDEDRKLLTYLEIVTKAPVAPAKLPLKWDTRIAACREYVLLGRKSLSIVVLLTKTSTLCDITALNLDRVPDTRIIQRYEETEAFKDWYSLEGHKTRIPLLFP